MNIHRDSIIRKTLAVLLLFPLLSLANEAEKPAADPHAPHHGATPPAASPEASAPAEVPAKVEPEAPKAEESSSKGLIVNRAPDFCMKKDPPPHCAE